MKVIHKQIVNFRKPNPQVLDMPVGYTLLACDFQGDEFVIWYIFDGYESNTWTVEFFLIRTGEPVPDLANRELEYFGTAYDRSTENPFVLHLFESHRKINPPSSRVLNDDSPF